MKYFRSHEKNIYLKCGCSMLCPTTRYTHVSISTLLKSFCPIFSLFRLLLMRPTCFFLSSHSRRRRRSRRWCCCFLSLIHYTFFCSRFFHVCFFLCTSLIRLYVLLLLFSFVALCPCAALTQYVSSNNFTQFSSVHQFDLFSQSFPLCTMWMWSEVK